MCQDCCAIYCLKWAQQNWKLFSKNFFARLCVTVARFGEITPFWGNFALGWGYKLWNGEIPQMQSLYGEIQTNRKILVFYHKFCNNWFGKIGEILKFWEYFWEILLSQSGNTGLWLDWKENSKNLTIHKNVKDDFEANLRLKGQFWKFVVHIFHWS